MSEQKVIIDNSWFENPQNNSLPDTRDPYELVCSPDCDNPNDYSIM